MARSDLLIQLVKAALSNDKGTVEKSTETIIAEERKKQHHILADRLTHALQSSVSRAIAPPPRNTLRQTNGHMLGTNARDFIAERRPSKNFEELILPVECLELSRELVEEQHRAAVLRAHDLEPRHRVLLAGPPGNGKTSLAEAIAYELSVPFFIVRYETVIGSFLGETSARLKQIFEYAKTVPCVLFFDEFDTLGKERGDSHETGEIKRVVSSLLLQVDDLPSYTVVITATNHPELLDKAVWRRFQLRVDLPKPNRAQLECFFDRNLARFKEDPGYKSSTLAKYIYGASFAEAEDFCLDVQRRHVLSMGEATLQSIISDKLRHWKARFSPSSPGESS